MSFPGWCRYPEGTRQQINDAREPCRCTFHLKSRDEQDHQGNKGNKCEKTKKIASVLGTTIDYLLIVNVESETI